MKRREKFQRIGAKREYSLCARQSACAPDIPLTPTLTFSFHNSSYIT
jgi:hypothetical protein